jgi:hypothetical protein
MGFLDASRAAPSLWHRSTMNGDIYPDVTRNLAMKIAGKNRGHYIMPDIGIGWRRKTSFPARR